MGIALRKECESCNCEPFRQRNSKSRRTCITQDKCGPICSNRSLRKQRSIRNGLPTSCLSGPDEGRLYLAVGMDLCSWAIIGWSMNQWMTQQLVCSAPTMALFGWHFPKGTDPPLWSCRELMGYAETWDRQSTATIMPLRRVSFTHWKSNSSIAKGTSLGGNPNSASLQSIEKYFNRQRIHSAMEHQIPMIFEVIA